MDEKTRLDRHNSFVNDPLLVFQCKEMIQFGTDYDKYQYGNVANLKEAEQLAKAVYENHMLFVAQMMKADVYHSFVSKCLARTDEIKTLPFFMQMTVRNKIAIRYQDNPELKVLVAKYALYFAVGRQYVETK